jgi:hypothetical protein
MMKKNKNMLTDPDLNEVDNLLRSLGPDSKIRQILEQYTGNLNNVKENNHIINTEEIGNEENILAETNPDEILNFASSMEETELELQDKNKSDNTFLNVLEVGRGVNSENMSIENKNHITFTYSIIVDQNDIPTVIMPENSENLECNPLPKKKKSTRKIRKPKKSTIGIEIDEKSQREIHNFSNNILLNGLEIHRGVDSEKMSNNAAKSLPLTIDEDYIPTVIQRGIIPENSNKKKK